MAIRIIITDSSIWTLDYTKMEFNRAPRTPGADHPLCEYTEEWHNFTHLEECGTQWPERIRFIVYGNDVDGQGSSYITSTYKPTEQHPRG